jgi:hypothetical protein
MVVLVTVYMRTRQGASYRHSREGAVSKVDATESAAALGDVCGGVRWH